MSWLGWLGPLDWILPRECESIHRGDMYSGWPFDEIIVVAIAVVMIVVISALVGLTCLLFSCLSSP